MVLDVEKIEEYSVLPLPNPFRLVVDIRGVSQSEQEADRGAPPPIGDLAATHTSRALDRCRICPATRNRRPPNEAQACLRQHTR